LDLGLFIRSPLGPSQCDGAQGGLGGILASGSMAGAERSEGNRASRSADAENARRCNEWVRRENR